MTRDWPMWWFGLFVSFVPPMGMAWLAWWVNNPGGSFLLGMFAGALAFVGGMISGAAKNRWQP